MTGVQTCALPISITDVQNGALDTTFSSPTSVKPRIAAGAIRALAMTGPQRSASMPELATFSEQGVPNVDLAIWVGAYAPAGTPRAIIDRYSEIFSRAVKSPAGREILGAFKVPPTGGPPEMLDQVQRADAAKWGAIIKAAGIRVEE